MNIRRVLLDIDKAIEGPSVLQIAEAISQVGGVEGINITVTEIDIETVGMEVTVEGDQIDYAGLEKAVHGAGAALHSIDELVVGQRMVERRQRARQ